MSRENDRYDDTESPLTARRPASRHAAGNSPLNGPTGTGTRIPKPGETETESGATGTQATAGRRPPFPRRRDYRTGQPPQTTRSETGTPIPPIRHRHVGEQPTGTPVAEHNLPQQRAAANGQTGTHPSQPSHPQGSAEYPFPSRRTAERRERPERPASLAEAYGRAPIPTPAAGLPSRAQETKIRKQVKQRKRSRVKTGVILLSVVAILAACFYLAYNALTSDSLQTEAGDYPGPGTTEVVAVINPGDSGTVIAKKLVELDVIKTEAAFIRAWEANQAAQSVQPGSYTLKQKMSSADAVAALLDPTKRTSNAVSIASGFTIWQVAERLKANENFTAEEVDAAIANPSDLGLPAEANGKLEGWLQPGSYEVHTDDKPADVLRAMVQARIAELDALKVPAEQRQNVLIKASILEREVNGPTYMGKVARVIENRLTKPEAETVGLLQMDSTVLYGVHRAGGIPTSEEIKKDTPYNTYIHKGLPPGPISMPSKAAIEATLNPEPGDWLYFVTVNLDTGETKFSSTNKEHEKFVKELSSWCEANKGKC
ncbi:endolytic transglycosylase MltG [Gleimia sp. 6138-11-ORH1]|uniref:endolytic transglycosylase MltG n=1 Tax=Gleimia sp. 6138-11-ORH1 TaxID=2973937 RepID=UPI0021691E58|nr:endolytic transglycosylase MltG [Gleimia sp. 6138-11-ORH1]MCS4484391.1 endolytic transglycosylase MltG [Gleimia sp. 6138-11-ORH1]